MADVFTEACWLADRPYRVQLRCVDTHHYRVWQARHPELPNCRAWGDSADEALDALAEKRLSCLMQLLLDDRPIPEPMGALETVALPKQRPDRRTTPSGSRKRAAIG